MTDELSSTELKVLVMLSHGLQYKEISAKNFVCLNTTKFHCKNIYFKLRAHNAAHAISIAYLEGILPVQGRLF